LAGNNTAHHAPISVIPNGVDLDYFQPPAGPQGAPSNTLVFSGKMSYHANITMAHYLVHEIMPLVWSQRQDVQLTIVGKDPPREVMAFAGDDRITVTGTVPDVRPYLQQASIAVAPLRYGAGIQNKILEAMACGTATITTRQALAALNALEGRQILVADDAPAFAAAIVSLLGDVERRQAVAAAGLDYVQQHHNWSHIVKKLEGVYRSAITSLLRA
jgi:glycosyltransferase involved in cell wall biosynthesis